MPKSIKPIQQPVAAKPHRPVYRMHRYFARRPYSVFAELIRHYTDPNDLILDPFCGGGVTLVEGLLQGRRVIGFDVNPLATFITRMELADIDLDSLLHAQDRVTSAFRPASDELFATSCRQCSARAAVQWFEYSAVAVCSECANAFRVSDAQKKQLGGWACPRCGSLQRFSTNAHTRSELIAVLYSCDQCGHTATVGPLPEDSANHGEMEDKLRKAEKAGLWIPSEKIPDCNMQRESALFKKGITTFRQLFTPRHLIALGSLRQAILEHGGELREWLLFAFSSTLRYTSRMVTRNPGWRGNRPLEWAKPGFWLPPVHLEANVLVEYSRRFDALYRGKKDYLAKLGPKRPAETRKPAAMLNKSRSLFFVSTRSATRLPLPDESVDAIITDPPYGSYVHYADLCNFWSVWLPDIPGLGSIIDNTEEAVIARKSFPGAKSAADYQALLERCFAESARVLKKDGYMVLTFHNREPRAWAALVVAATRAGFFLPPRGLMFQDGIPSYRHTAQSRRAGSVIGDFVITLRKQARKKRKAAPGRQRTTWISEKEFVGIAARLLRDRGPLGPSELMAQLYLEFHQKLFERARLAIAQGDDTGNKLLEDFDSVRLFDSHRKQLLQRHFSYNGEEWSLGRHDGAS